MKKLLMVGAAVLALASGVAFAEEKAEAKAEKKAPAPSKDLTIVGVLEKSEAKKKDGTSMPVYQVKSEDGSMTRLPAKVAVKKGQPAVNLDDFVGAKVTVTGKGREMTTKKGVVRMIGKIDSIAKVEAPAAPAQQ